MIHNTELVSESKKRERVSQRVSGLNNTRGRSFGSTCDLIVWRHAVSLLFANLQRHLTNLHPPPPPHPTPGTRSLVQRQNRDERAEEEAENDHQPGGQGGAGAQLRGEKQAVVPGNSPHRQGPPPGEGGGPRVVLQQAAAGEAGQNQPEPQFLSGQNGPKLHHADE